MVLTKAEEPGEKQNDPARICGNIWAHGSDKQREGFGQGTEGRDRNEKPPAAWWDACTRKVSQGKEMNDIEKVVREEDLKALYAYERGLEEAPTIYKGHGYLKAGLQPEEPMVFVASEESEDRMGDIVSSEGWMLDSYRKNPVYLYSHLREIPPVGICPKVWVQDKQLLNTVRWDDGDEFAKMVRGKYQRRVMQAESVGFRALEFEERKDGAKGVHFKKSELVEISAVVVPAHPNALAKALTAMGRVPFVIIMPPWGAPQAGEQAQEPTENKPPIQNEEEILSKITGIIRERRESIK